MFANEISIRYSLTLCNLPQKAFAKWYGLVTYGKNRLGLKKFFLLCRIFFPRCFSLNYKPSTVLNSKGIQSLYIFCLGLIIQLYYAKSLYISQVVGNQQLNECFWPILKYFFHFIAFFFISLNFVLIEFLVWRIQNKKIKHERLQADPIPAKISNSVS